jgi:probable HAF family extracellular repeat protein
MKTVIVALIILLLFTVPANAQVQYEIIDLGPPGINSWARDISDSGQIIVGTNANYYLIYSSGTITDLGTFGGNQTNAYEINNSGQVVGNYSLNGWHSALYDNGTWTDLGISGESYAFAINNSGQIVGYSTNSFGTRIAFLFDNGAMTELGTLNGNSTAYGINDIGQVVGSSGNAFLWDSSNGMQNLNDFLPSSSGWTLTTANAINNAGQIVGNGYINGEQHAFLMTVIPEPLSTTLFLVGGATLGFRRFRKKFRK